MDYYRCAKTDLHQELTRRGHQAYGEKDEAAERLKTDDEQRGSIATTVHTATEGGNLVRTWKVNPEYGKTVPAGLLINERMTHRIRSLALDY